MRQFRRSALDVDQGLSSQLPFRVTNSVGPAALEIMILHGGNGWVDDLAPLMRAVNLPIQFCAAQALSGKFAGRSRTGYDWFRSIEPGQIDPHSFGVSVWHLERLLESRCGLLGNVPLIVVGHGQGAMLALRVATDRPDLVVGIAALGEFSEHAINASEWSLDSLQVLLIDRLNDPDRNARREATENLLLERGATVEFQEADSLVDLPLGASEALRQWLLKRYVIAR